MRLIFWRPLNIVPDLDMASLIFPVIVVFDSDDRRAQGRRQIRFGCGCGTRRLYCSYKVFLHPAPGKFSLMQLTNVGHKRAVSIDGNASEMN